MKQLLFVLFIAFTTKSIGQTEFKSILKNVIKVNLPYTSISPSANLEKTRKILQATDSLLVVTQLNRKEPKTINRYGDSPFGQIDCEETANNPELTEVNDCLKIAEMKEIAILCYIKISDYEYLLHLELTKKGEFGESKGILLSVNQKGDVIDWFFSNGSANSGNPNGNVRRDFTIQKNLIIDVEESSWGKENIPYLFKAKYNLNTGEFNLKNLSIQY